MKKGFRIFKETSARLVSLFSVACLFGGSLYGSPRNPVIRDGEVSVQQAGTVTTITASDKAIIDWQSFSIGADEEVAIILPDTSSRVLNRVNGTTPSEVLGRLTSNGRILLVNEEGIHIERDGYVACDAFTASTLPLAGSSFLKGDGSFFSGDNTGGLVCAGTIECERDIVLVGAKIENKQLLRSKKGTVCLAAGNGAFVKEEQPPSTAYIKWSITPTEICNSGVIEANTVLLRAHGMSTETSTITNTGSISTSAVREKSTVIHADEGTFVHSGTIRTQGGGVTIIGKKILLTDSSAIDSSAEKDGGNIFIGGGWKGKDSEIPNAEVVCIERKATINANSTVQGNGGDVVVWANDRNSFLGTLSANGSGNEGKGGNAEISAKETLVFDGSVTLHSETAKQGSLLLDPVSITIQASSPDINGNGSNYDMTLATQLDNAHTTPAGFQNAASIITSGAVGGLLTGGVSMRLAAQNFITVHDSITATGVGNSIFFDAPTINLHMPILSGASTAVTLTGAGATVNVGGAGVIQEGVDVAAVGGTVNLASSVYTQEVDIEKNLTLNGNGIGNTLIVCPAALLSNAFTTHAPLPVATYHPFVMAHGGTNIIIQNMTVNGNSQATNFLNYRFLGIGYYDAGGTVSNVRATGVQDMSPGGPTQHGQAIFAAIDDGNPYTLNVLNCTVDNFQKTGISMRGPTLTAVISGNVVTGETPFSAATANGIQISSGATATITNNTVTNLHCTTFPSNESVGIIMFGEGNNTTVTNNVVNANDIGIYSDAASNGLHFSNNTVNNNIDVGMVVENSSGVNGGTFTITGNSMTNNTNENMFLYSASNQPFALATNQFFGSQNGLVVQGEDIVGPVITMDHDSFVGTAGFYIQEAVNPSPPYQSAPNNIWPSTATVSFDGLVSGQITQAQFNQLLTKIFGKHNDPLLGLVLVFIPPPPPPPPSVILPPSKFCGEVKRRHHPSEENHFVLRAHWKKSLSPNVRIYNIYANGKLVKKVSSNHELTFTCHRHTQHVRKKYQISAVSSGGLESTKVKLKLKH